MNIVPVVLAFDNNLAFPACICLSSLMMNAKESTFYDIFILHPASEELEHEELDKIPSYYPNCKIQYIAVDDTFAQAYEIRGITTPAYYRLLIPELIPQYDKILYSDVDVIFRFDLSEFYNNTDLEDYYVAGVNSLSYLIPEYDTYFKDMGRDSRHIVYSGNLLINSQKMRKDALVQRFVDLSVNRYKFQDMDILNIVCEGKIKYVEPDFCLSTIISEWAVHNRKELKKLWNDESIERALSVGIIHYNGHKPWVQYCINFDIWWEYYRKSPFFNPKYYFDFYYYRLNIYDQLSLWHRIKILVRYFVYGKRVI